ncbi:hypothetical protein HDU81_000265 [Chytriomyces hyalinus]|nr:hypothetical protein HDU81_000265 [Chytriomyces hyalinus]
MNPSDDEPVQPDAAALQNFNAQQNAYMQQQEKRIAYLNQALEHLNNRLNMLLAVPEVPPAIPAVPAPRPQSLFRMPSVKPITFSGSFRNKPAHKVQNLLDDYLERSHEICILYGFAPSTNQTTQLNQPTFVQFTSSGLSKNACIAWRQISKDNRIFMTWGACATWIQDTFGSTLTLDQALNTMDNLRQTTSAVIYSAKFNELVSAISAANIDYSQKHLCSCYRKGLKPHLRATPDLICIKDNLKTLQQETEQLDNITF